MSNKKLRPIPPVMLLAAGRGSRLRPLTDRIPKPLLALAGRPLIDRQLEQLEGAGAKRVVINSFHLAEQLEQHIGELQATRRTAGKPSTLEVRLSREPRLLETGGGILYAQELLDAEEIWILNGDILMNAPLDRFPRLLPSGQDLHLLLRPTPVHRNRGDFDWQAGTVTGRGDGYVYCGLALLSLPALRTYAATLPELDDEVPVFSLQGFLFDRVAAGRVGGTQHQGYWFDIGTPEQLEAADQFLATGIEDA